MLSTRLFKNFAVSHHLKSIASSSAPRRADLALPLRLRAGASRLNSSVVPPLSKSQPEPSSPSEQVSSSSIEPPAADSSAPTGNKIRLEQPDPRLSITFTCTVIDCNTRSTHEFSKRSYTSGIVLVECPGCKNRHLIADHLGWFKDGTEEGKFKTIEEMMKSRGETVRRGRLDNGGVVEYAPDA